jgi:hypothetical protein
MALLVQLPWGLGLNYWTVFHKTSRTVFVADNNLTDLSNYVDNSNVEVVDSIKVQKEIETGRATHLAAAVGIQTTI